MKRTTLLILAALAPAALGAARALAVPAAPAAGLAIGGIASDDPDLKKKIVPIITVGSSLNVGVAQVSGEERDVNRCKAVAQLETDYKDIARIKILVPVQTQNVVQHIDRVPGVSVVAIADYAIKR